MALNLKVGPIGAFDMLKFKNSAKTREKHIQRAPAAPLPKDYALNRLARELHPEKQEMRVMQVIELSPGVKQYTLKTADASAAAPFRAGEYVSVAVEIGGTKTTRPYSLCSAPGDAKNGVYAIAVKRLDGGFVSDYILDNWTVGTAVTISGPQGNFCYEPLRDGKRVVGLAGGSGITPFLSMACAIRDGLEDFDLTVLFGSRTEADILFEKEFSQIAASCGRVRLVNVLSDETKPGFEHGFLTAELIGRYLTDDASIFVCGPRVMYEFLQGELKKLPRPAKSVRFELLGVTKEPWKLAGYPDACRGKTFTVTVLTCGKKLQIPASATETVLTAIERAGIAAPSRCRSGECGYCHSRLVSGDVFIPEDTDGRRAADKVFGYIHPCASFPVSDLVIELPGTYL